MHCKIFVRFSVLYPLDASSMQSSPSVMTTKMTQDMAQCPLRDKITTIENCWSRGQCHDYVYHNLWLYMVTFAPINSQERTRESVFIWADEIKYHRFSGSNNKYLFSQSFGERKF